MSEKSIPKISYWRIANYVIYSVVIIFALFALSTKIPVPGNYKLFTVMSGSMAPTIKTGSLVITKPAKVYQINDIITFENPQDTQKTITHRIIETKKENNVDYFITKGDANSSPDAVNVYPKMIIGKVRLILPFVGYPIAFSKTLPGLIIFIIIPATIIIYDEILKIKNEIEKKWKRFRRKKTK